MTKMTANVSRDGNVVTVTLALNDLLDTTISLSTRDALSTQIAYADEVRAMPAEDIAKYISLFLSQRSH